MDSEVPLRKIIHVDMDAFYASVEQLDNPELRGKPIAVGGSSERGVVSAASYEARKFGVRSAMSSVIAKRNCPELIFVKVRFDRYREISKSIRKIFHDYTDLVEPLSLDEAYLDVTINKKGNPSATLIAQEIRQRIYDELQLTASAGISINKFIAKIASDSEKMYKLGIFTGKDLKSKSLEFLTEKFGKSGGFYFNVVRGIHTSEVKAHRIPKSVGAERTFSENLSSEIFMLERLEQIATEIERRLKKSNIAGKTITLKIKYSDFTLQTRSKTLPYFVADKALILETAKALLYQEKMENSVRLLGISLANLNTEKKQDNTKEEPILVQLKFDF